MSKRLQVLFEEKELREIKRASRASHQSVADWVRDGIRMHLKRAQPRSPEEHLAAILAFAAHSAPIGEIDVLLKEIERGRGLGA